MPPVLAVLLRISSNSWIAGLYMSEGQRLRRLLVLEGGGELLPARVVALARRLYLSRQPAPDGISRSLWVETHHDWLFPEKLPDGTFEGVSYSNERFGLDPSVTLLRFKPGNLADG